MHRGAWIYPARSLRATHDRISFWICVCTSCFTIFGGRDQKDDCDADDTTACYERNQTLTLEDERDFEAFKRGRGKYVIPCMKPLSLVFSDQPYLPRQPKKRTTKFTEPPLYKKAKKETKTVAASTCNINKAPLSGDDGVSFSTRGSSIKGSTWAGNAIQRAGDRPFHKDPRERTKILQMIVWRHA